MRVQRRNVVPLILIGLLIPPCLCGADDDAQKEASVRRLAAMKEIIKGVEMTIGKEGRAKLARIEEPIQRWSNPIIPIEDATVFLWTQNGRPAFVAQVAAVTGKGLWQEFQSLTTEPLQGRIGNRNWAPTTAGIRWMSAPTNDAPAGTAVLRLVQMRKIAEKYSVSDVFEFKEPNQLRLLAKPLYRYSALEAGVVDGAIFSFALGTDPEVLLLVECQKENDCEVWKSAFGRLTGFACKATLDDQEVWSSKVLPWPTPTESTFMAIP
jgi:hypothetical protein